MNMTFMGLPGILLSHIHTFPSPIGGVYACHVILCIVTNVDLFFLLQTFQDRKRLLQEAQFELRSLLSVHEVM